MSYLTTYFSWLKLSVCTWQNSVKLQCASGLVTNIDTTYEALNY